MLPVVLLLFLLDMPLYKKKCVCKFNSLLIPLYGLTCHVDDYNSEILSFDWSMAWTNARRENTILVVWVVQQRYDLSVCKFHLLFVSVFFFFISFWLVFCFFIQRISQLTAIHLNQCDLKESDAKEKRCVLLMLISCSRLYFCILRLAGERVGS